MPVESIALGGGGGDVLLLVDVGNEHGSFAPDKDAQAVLDQFGPSLRPPGAERSGALVHVPGVQSGGSAVRTRRASEVSADQGVILAAHGNVLAFLYHQARMDMVGLVGIVGAGAGKTGLTEENHVHGKPPGAATGCGKGSGAGSAPAPNGQFRVVRTRRCGSPRAARRRYGGPTVFRTLRR